MIILSSSGIRVKLHWRLSSVLGGAFKIQCEWLYFVLSFIVEVLCIYMPSDQIRAISYIYMSKQILNLHAKTNAYNKRPMMVSDLDVSTSLWSPTEHLFIQKLLQIKHIKT